MSTKITAALTALLLLLTTAACKKNNPDINEGKYIRFKVNGKQYEYNKNVLAHFYQDSNNVATYYYVNIGVYDFRTIRPKATTALFLQSLQPIAPGEYNDQQRDLPTSVRASFRFIDSTHNISHHTNTSFRNTGQSITVIVTEVSYPHIKGYFTAFTTTYLPDTTIAYHKITDGEFSL